jgi:hypothetical protein
MFRKVNKKRELIDMRGKMPLLRIKHEAALPKKLLDSLALNFDDPVATLLAPFHLPSKEKYKFTYKMQLQ